MSTQTNPISDMELPERGWVFSDGKGSYGAVESDGYAYLCFFKTLPPENEPDINSGFQPQEVDFEEAREFVKSQPPETLGLMLFEGITPINIHFVRSLSEGKT